MQIVSGREEATMRYASHMGSCDYVPALGWAQIKGKPETRVERSGYEFPDMDGAALEAKCAAILRNRRYGKFGVR
jgi:hypothetical protein